MLANSDYQGTVLGPFLWNVFYSDSKAPVKKCGYTEAAFADDLNCWEAFGIPPNPEGMRGPLPGHFFFFCFFCLQANLSQTG